MQMLLKNLDPSLILLISIAEEMDCNLSETFVNLTTLGAIISPLWANAATEPQITTKPHLSCSFNSLFTKQCTVVTIHSEPDVNPSIPDSVHCADL